MEGSDLTSSNDTMLVQSGIYNRGTILSFHAWNIKVVRGIPSGFYYLPVSWKTNPSGSWSPKAPGDDYTASFDTTSMTLGNHTLVVTYALTEYNATTSTWGTPNLDDTVTRSIDYTLVAASPSPTPSPTSSSSTVASSSSAAASSSSTTASSSSAAASSSGATASSSSAAASSSGATASSSGSNSTNRIPATGDATNLWLWMIVLLLAATTVTSILYRRNKEKHSR